MSIFVIFAFLFQIYFFTFFVNWSITVLVEYILWGHNLLYGPLPLSTIKMLTTYTDLKNIFRAITC